MTKQSQLEALLFVAGDEGLSVEILAQLLEQNASQTKLDLENLAQHYLINEDSALFLLMVNDHYQLATKEKYAPLIQRFLQAPQQNHLSQSVLETLTIIAYQQPITRIQIDDVRGVHSQAAIQKLVLRQLIESKGRLNAPGRPILYGTSAYFMDYFGLKNIADLPDLSQLQAGEEEAVQEDLFSQTPHTAVTDHH